MAVMLEDLKKIRVKRLNSRKVPREIKRLIAEEDLLERFHDKKKQLNRACKNKIKQIVSEMILIANKIPSLKGWPYNRHVFWGEDSSIWQHRIDDEHRDFIRKKLKNLVKGRILEIGSGSVPYTEGVCLDISYNMLWTIKPSLSGRFMNPYLSRVQADLEKGLCFSDNSFDTIVGVFVANYVKDLRKLFSEVKRVLKKNGKLVLVQSLVPVNTSHIIMEKHKAKGFGEELRKIIGEEGFKVRVKKESVGKKAMWFVVAYNIL